jgi:hypothetical protein
MTRLKGDKVGLFLRQQSAELTRIWRMARASARPEIFPGLLDDVVSRFFERAGELLERGGPPEELWAGLRGVVRWPASLPAEELTEEWAVLLEVVAASCEAVNAEPEVTQWLMKATSFCVTGTAALGEGARRPGLLTTLVFSSLAPRARRAEKDESPA